MTFRWKTSLLLFLAPTLSSACPAGETLQQGVGWQMCVPIPGMNGNSSPPNRADPVWADRWGAIAVDHVPKGSVGFSASSGISRKRQAEKEALEGCRSKGGTKCEIMITYRNQCASLIWGDHGFTTSGAASEEEASRRGMDKCIVARDTNCEVFYSGCSLPQQVR